MTTPLVSVVVVSRHRPHDLRRCVRALDFQTYRNFELILVTDAETAKSLSSLAPTDRLKSAICAEANISKARNLGVMLAAGDVAAFIDDDAIAEPTWLARLVAPFTTPEVAASGGFVRGRNGISLQWQAEEIAPDGESLPIRLSGHSAQIMTAGRAIKTQGTNCAFRRDTLIALGGFDENYRFYLDETDVNLRIAQAGFSTAIVPDAEVQHGYAPSPMRGRDRRPKSLFEIGASQAYFVQKYGRPDSDLDALRRRQSKRLDTGLVRGILEPCDVLRLKRDLEAGIAQGRTRQQKPAPPRQNAPDFKPFASKENLPAHRYVSGHWSERRSIYNRAKALSDAGTPCTAIVLSRTALFHRRWFHSDGFWVQSGGIFGKSSRSQPLWSWYRLSERVKVEQHLLDVTR
ncbi:glycosyltransferase family 2 protein [Litoreibacter albidus]|uniref:Glycosyltransferase like family 2 n=1 Tax=Litoreibacter albidus TaxID=670155 RepID=A0A1H2WAI4_9RHOB|nr:glycosyltransferase [Litoreibacter albidus]SDW77703.1 Glycosyltransferase like family 2 [Litoreibacter albidus]